MVEVGELDGDHKPLMDLNVQGNNLNVVKKNGIMHGQENCINLNKPVGQGWFPYLSTLATNPCVARNNYFYGSCIKFFFTI